MQPQIPGESPRRGLPIPIGQLAAAARMARPRSRPRRHNRARRSAAGMERLYPDQIDAMRSFVAALESPVNGLERRLSAPIEIELIAA